jgi:hypothetical protein
MRFSCRFARLTRLCAFGVAASLPGAALAYHPLVTDDTGTQGSAGNQLEISHDQARSDLDGVVSVGREFPITYTRGLTDNLDLVVGVSRVTSPAQTWGNGGLGAKWRFYEDEAGKFSLALKPEVILPVSAAKEAQGLGVGKTSYGLTLILTKETSFGEVHVNLATEHDNYADAGITDRRNLNRISVAPVWAVAEGWKLALDVGFQTNADRNEKTRMGYVELGLVYSPSKDLDFGLGITRDVMDGPVRSDYVTLGLTWRFR